MKKNNKKAGKLASHGQYKVVGVSARGVEFDGPKGGTTISFDKAKKILERHLESKLDANNSESTEGPTSETPVDTPTTDETGGEAPDNADEEADVGEEEEDGE